jgi:hypothetical protein
VLAREFYREDYYRVLKDHVNFSIGYIFKDLGLEYSRNVSIKLFVKRLIALGHLPRNIVEI